MPFDLHLFLELGTALATVFVFVTGLMIKAAQAKNREELLAQQQKVKDDLLEKHQELLGGQTSLRVDFDAKHAENTQAIAVHSASDDAKFTGISRTLKRIDGKLDQMAPRRRVKK
jgi:hypothetical protein